MSYRHVLAGRSGVGACKRRSKKHYQRMQLLSLLNLPSQEERFWDKIVKKSPNECWSWSGATTTKGYGIMRWNGKNKVATRIMWELKKGPIPKGQRVLHECDNPPCCNPRHLFLGTIRENAHDMMRKHRDNINGKKLVEKDVIAIRSDAGTNKELSDEFGVCPSHVWRIRTGKCWCWI